MRVSDSVRCSDQDLLGIPAQPIEGSSIWLYFFIIQSHLHARASLGFYDSIALSVVYTRTQCKWECRWQPPDRRSEICMRITRRSPYLLAIETWCATSTVVGSRFAHSPPLHRDRIESVQLLLLFIYFVVFLLLLLFCRPSTRRITIKRNFRFKWHQHSETYQKHTQRKRKKKRREKQNIGQNGDGRLATTGIHRLLVGQSRIPRESE